MTTRRRPPAGPPSLRRPPRDGREGCDLVSSRVGRLGSSGWAMIFGPVPGAGRWAVGGCGLGGLVGLGARRGPRARGGLRRGLGRGGRRLGARPSAAGGRLAARLAPASRRGGSAGCRRAAGASGCGSLAARPALAAAGVAVGAGAGGRRVGCVGGRGGIGGRGLVLLAARGHLQRRAVGLEDPARARRGRGAGCGPRGAPGRWPLAARLPGCAGGVGGGRRPACGRAVAGQRAERLGLVDGRGAAVTSMPAARSA